MRSTLRDIHLHLPRTSDYLTLSRHEADYSCRRAPVEQLKLNVRQLLLVQSEVVAEFVDDSQADLCADFGLTGADCFDILLIEVDEIWFVRQVEHALLTCRQAMEDA